MPVYQGGKTRLGRRIHAVIKSVEKSLKTNSKENDYFEPFCGMCGVMKHFENEDRKLLACDINEDMILMWNALKEGWIPPKKCDRELFDKLKKDVPSPARAFIGTVASWGGIFFQAYRLNSEKGKKDFVGEGYRSLLKMKKSIMKVDFIEARSYDSFHPRGTTIYCDPLILLTRLSQNISKILTINYFGKR